MKSSTKNGLILLTVAVIFAALIYAVKFAVPAGEDAGVEAITQSQEADDVAPAQEATDEQKVAVIMLGGGLILILSVVITVVSSTVSSVASVVEDEE